MEKNFWANKPRHKAIALVLLVCMLMTLVPAMAWAETTPTNVATAEEFISAITSGSSIKLTGNVTVSTSSALEIAGGKNLTLDLNDKTLTLTSPSALTLNGALTISDSGANHSGKFVGDITNRRNDNLTITGGTFGFDPKNYVDTKIYDVTQPDGERTWTVTTKPSGPVNVAEIKITADSDQVLAGGNIILTATLGPDDATSGTSLTWASNAPSKVMINKETATGLLQTATVTLTSAAVKDDAIKIWATNENGVKSDEYTLTVVDKITPTLTLSPASMTLQVGKSDNLTATLSPAVADAELVWSVTAGQNFIQLDKTETSGTHTVNVTASAAGAATISVSVKGDATIAATCAVTVTGEAPIPVTGISLDNPTLSLAADASEIVKATIDPSDANQGTTLTWISDNENVAKVVVSADTHSATITGAGPGTATVTVSNGAGVDTTCIVTVAERPVTEIKLSSEQLNLFTGNGSGNLTATVLPTNATTGTTLTWESDNIAVVTVTPATDTHSADYAAVGVGNATITVKSGSISATCAVVVTDTEIFVNEITLDQTALALDLNGKTTGSIKATVAPADANKDAALTWTSSNPSVAAVAPANTTGTSEVTVTAVGVGETTITVSNGKITKECVVTVTDTKPEVTNITLNKLVDKDSENVTNTEQALAVGAILGLNAELDGNNLSAVEVTWTSSNKSVADVDENGAVTAKSSGAAKITAIVDGNFTQNGQPLTASCDVKVTAVVIPPELQGNTIAQELAGNNATKATVEATNTDISNAIGISPTDPNTKVYLDTQLASIEKDTDNNIVITYQIKPMKVETTGEGGEVTTTTSVIDNTKLNGAITFRLPVPDNITEKYVKIQHTISDTGRVEYLYAEIQTEGGHKFVEVTVYKFSDFVVSFANELPAEAPEATPNKGRGTYVGTQVITLNIPDGAQVYYTVDGSEPTVANADPYKGSITITKTTTLKVLVVHPDYLDGIYEYTYTITNGGDDGIIDGGDSGSGGSSGGGGGSTGGGGGTVVTPNNNSWDNPYFDVSSTAWYYNAVKYAVEKGLFSGVTDTQFGPNVSMTRGMLVTVLYKLEGRPAAGGNSFIDVSSNAYYSNAVAWAASKNIVSGIGDGMFAPGQAISREQMVVILYKYAQSKGMDTSASASLSNFADYDKVSPWAREAMQWAVGAGLISGKNGSILDPTGTATRAEVASILMNFLED